jgi:hypothetical protein
METEPSIFAKLYEFGWALLAYWWVLVPGGIFAVEPMMEAFISPSHKETVDKYWPKAKRHRHFRWLSFIALAVASFLAFDDVNTRSRALHKTDQVALNTALVERDEARRQLIDAQSKLSAAQSALDQLRSSRGAASTKDRSKFIAPLQRFYAIGSALQRNLLTLTITDAQIDQNESDIDRWLNDVAVWIQANMGVAAASRFLNNSDKTSHSFNLPGDHVPGKKDKRDLILNSLSGCLTNLETLMKSDQWDPQ